VAEEKVNAGDIEIAFERFGDPAKPTILLIMGLGVQMVGWDEGFCTLLADRGFQVVRYDNRDVGRSTWFDDAQPPDMLAAMAGDFSSASYRLSDMAADAVGLLDALEVDAAHVVGVSMGGMIAQTLAIEHPDRVLSMTSIMSTTGDQSVGQPTPEAMQALMAPPAPNPEAMADGSVAIYSVIGSPGYPMDEERVRALAAASWERGYNPLGVARQLVGVLASGDRTEALGDVDVPTQVIHGADDPLINRSGGEATAAAIPGAKLEVIDGMGHDLPKDLWPRFADLIVANTERASQESQRVNG
jgi:pimeloyl-ACP methyl ester carboxylesterase